jgi:DNA-binding transcriptional regulator YdaS (Cro superfamily)
MTSAHFDEGLRLAVKKAGSIRALAFELGISAPALLVWKRVPAHRILQLEAVTGIRREKLRPDLYRSRRKLTIQRPPASASG